MGLLVEFLVEFVLQFVVESLADLGLRALNTRPGRLVATGAAGLAGGAVWGNVLRDRGHEATPRTLWASLAFALGGLAASVATRRAAAAEGRPALPPEYAFAPELLPWHWSPWQWDRFALLNVFVAFGIAAGFGLLT